MNGEQLQKENNELKARIERLREAAEIGACYSDKVPKNMMVIKEDTAEKLLQAYMETPSQSLNHILSKVEEETIEQFNTLGIWKWLSAALDDENVCAEMKIDITEAFTFLETRKYKEQSNED